VYSRFVTGARIPVIVTLLGLERDLNIRSDTSTDFSISKDLRNKYPMFVLMGNGVIHIHVSAYPAKADVRFASDLSEHD